MANYEITTKAGATYQLDLPDAMSETEVMDYFNNRYLPSLEEDTVNRPTLTEPSGDLTQFNKPVEQPTSEQIAQMQAEANPKDNSDFSRGFKTSYEQLPELGYGLEAGAYAIGETAFGEGGMLTQDKQEAVGKMIAAQKETQANAKESDSFTYAYQKAKEGDFGALADTVQYGIGYGLGQGTQAILAGGIGEVGAKLASEMFAKEYTAKLVEQEALKIAEQNAGRDITQSEIERQAVKNVAESIGTKGRDYTLGAQAVGLEGGEILGDLAKQSTEQNRALTPWEVSRGLGATALAAAGEFYADKFGLDVLGGKRLSEAGKYTEGLKGNLLRGAATGAKGAGIEGGTEFAQTLIEEVGKGKDPFSSESFRQAIDASALGFIGGGTMSGIGGVMSSAQQKPVEPTADTTEQTATEQTATTQPMTDWERTMGGIRGIVGKNQLVSNEVIAKDIAGANNVDDALQAFNHIGEAISTDHAITHELKTQEQQAIEAQRGQDQITAMQEPLMQEPIKAKADKLPATQESLDFIGQAVAQGGAELKGGMLYLPTGEKYSLNKAQRDHYTNLVTPIEQAPEMPTAETPTVISLKDITKGDYINVNNTKDAFNSLEAGDVLVTYDNYRIPIKSVEKDEDGNVINLIPYVEEGSYGAENLSHYDFMDVMYPAPIYESSRKNKSGWGSIEKNTFVNPNPVSNAPVNYEEAQNKRNEFSVNNPSIFAKYVINNDIKKALGEIENNTISKDDAMSIYNSAKSTGLLTSDTVKELSKVLIPTADYETRNSDRIARINQASTPEEIQSIYAEETSDNERHFEGTRKAEIAVKDKLNNLERESANKKEDEAYAAGEWVFHFPTNSLSDANQMAKSMEKIEPKNEYRVVPWQNDSYLVQKRKIEATPVAETPVAEPKGTINNPILRKNGKAFTSPQGAQTHIRTNPELSKDTHTWVKLGEEKYGIVTEDQVVRKPTKPAENLKKVTGFENIVSMIGKLGGLSRVEMSQRQLDDYKRNTALFNKNGRTFDDMATVLRVDHGFDEIKTGDDLDTILKDSLRSGKPYYGYEGIDKAMDKIAIEQADQDKQAQDELLNTYTNEEVNAILDAKTQAEKDKIIADIKAEKERKADLERDTLWDEMNGTGMTTSGDLFAPERKGKATVGREVTIEGEQLANSPLELKKLYPNHWFYGDKGAQSKFDETEIDYETQYPNLESVSLINTDSNIGGFYDQDEQAIYQTSQSDRTTIHELGHAIHHQLLNYRKLTEDERATLKELILGDAEANHPYLASDKELVAEFNLYAHVFPVKAKAYAPELYKELLEGRKDVSIKLGSQDNKALTAALKQANVTIEKGYGEETDNLKDQNRKTSDYVKEIDDYTKKEYVKQKLASNPKGDVEEITKQAEREHRAAIELRVAEGWGIYGANFEDYLDIWEKKDSLRKKYKEKEAKAKYTSKLKESSLENRRNEFLEEINDPSDDKTYKDRFYKEIDSLVKYLGFEKFKNTGVFTIFKNSKDEYLVFNNPNNFLNYPNMVAFDKKGNTLLEGSFHDFAKALSINVFGENHNGFSENDLKQIAGKIKEVYGDLSKLNDIVRLYSKYSPKNINEFTYDHPRFGYDRTDIFKYEMSKAIPNLIKPSSLKFSKARAWDFKPMSDEMRQNLINIGEEDFVARIDELENKVKTVADREENHRLRLSHKDVLARIPELEAAAKKLKEGLITPYEYELLSNELLPMTPYEELPPIATEQEARYALENGKGQSEKKAAKYGLPMLTFKDGEIIQLRLDIPSYRDHNTWVVSVHIPKSITGYIKETLGIKNGNIIPASDSSFKAGDSAGYQSVAIAKEVTFGMGETNALDIAGGTPKGTIATMMGKWQGTTIEEAKAKAEEAMNSKEWVQVGMNPLKHSYFYDRENSQPVIYADEIIQIGSLVLAKNPVYGRKSDFRFSETQQPATNTHTEQSLKEGLTKAGDDAYGKGWTDRLLGTGMFEIISDEQAQAIIENAVEVSYSKNGDIEAFYNPADGKTYFVAENIDKEKDLHYLMMHEVSVHMLKMGGNEAEFENFLKETDNLVKVKNPAAVKGRQDALDADTPQEDLREETLAYLIKYAPKLKIVQRFKAWLKNALRNMSKMFPASQKLGFIQWANNLSDQDLLYIANATLRKAPELLLKKSSEYEVAQAQEYFDRTGFMPYLSEGQLEIPIELPKFAIKTAAQAKWGIHSVLGIPMNKNETVSLYYPTTNAIARRVLQEGKLIADNPNANRIYLTNESAGYSVMENRGAITNEMDGAVVLIQIDPSLVQIEDSVEHKDGRRDFFIPIGEGEAFMKKPKMIKLFTLNQPREQGIAETTTLAEVGERIAKAIEEYKTLTDRQKATRYTRAKKVLKRHHNITTFLTENRKLEKTRVGDYGLTYEGNSVASQGLGLASAQKINNRNLSTCPVSAICEELCLGETSGQNLLYGGKGKYRSGARLSQYLKTEAMVLHPEEFAIAIAHEIKLYESWANQTFEYVRDPVNPKKFLRDPVTNDRVKIDKEIYQPAMRLNVTSDIPPTVFEPIMKAYPNVEFYDYTKLNSDSKLPNLHITYSSTGVSQIVNGVPIFNKHSNWRQSVQRLDTGFNVAMVFSDKNDMPKTVTDEATGKVYQVWNGDNYDARFLDPKRADGIGMIIGLTNKDNTGGTEDATERTKGFFVNYNKARDGDNVTILDQSKFDARAETYKGEKATSSIKFSKSKKQSTEDTAKEGEIVNRSTGYTAYENAKPIPEEVDNKDNYPDDVSLEEEKDWVTQQLRRFDSFRRLNDKSNELIDKYLTTMGYLPELGKYLGMRYKTLGKIDNVDDIVRNVFDTLQNATKEDSKEIYTYLTDNKATTDFIMDRQMAQVAKDLKEAIQIIGKKLVEFNIIPIESYQMYEGRYLPRVYLEHIIQSSDRYQSLGSGKTLSSMGYAKKRDNNLPEEVRRLLKGEVKNPAYLASRTISIPLRDIAMMEFFNQISDNEKWVWKQSLINIELDATTNRPTAIFDEDGVINYKATNSALEGAPKKTVVRKVTPYFLDKEADRILDQSYSAPEEDRKDMQDLAQMMKRAASQALQNMDAIPSDFIKMPNVAKYGSLRGLVVHKLIYDDLVGTINTYGATGEQTALENFFGNNGLLARITSAFKFSHVAVNIPTQVTNLLSNGILLHTSGVRFDKVPVRVIQAFKEVLNNGENYQKMVDMGGRKATFSNQELKGITDWLLENEAEFSDKDMDWFSMTHLFRELSYLTGKTVRSANNLHQNIEMIFKVAKFIDMKAKGATDGTAAVMAHRALFDYSFIPRWAKWLRTVPMGIPFITWTIKSFESTLRTLANRPTALLPYYMLGYALSLAAAADFGDDGEDKLKAILKLLPERMQRGGSVWILPMKDDAGRTQLIDMKNLFPWGKTAEGVEALSKLVGNQDVAELRTLADAIGVFSSPITQAVVAIDTNRDTFTGKQIIDENDTSAQKLQTILEYTYGMMMPPMLGSKGDIATIIKSQSPSSYEGIMNKDGSPKKTEEQAFIHLFTGLSIKSVDVDFERHKKIEAFNNMITGIKAQRTKELRANPNLGEEERGIVREKYDARIERVKEKKQKFKDETDVLK
jgi:hypothetical protein